jgi:hypothetical protein
MKRTPIAQLIRELQAMTDLVSLLTPDMIHGLRMAIEQAELKLVAERWELERIYRAGHAKTNDGSEKAAEVYVATLYTSNPSNP